MYTNFYEQHRYEKPTFPVIFHYDIVKKKNDPIYFHWHENIELLFFTRGEGRVVNGGKIFNVRESDVIVINANSIHTISPTQESVEYYCLIVDKSFCESMGFFIEDRFVKRKISDGKLNNIFDSIVEEMLTKRPYYESAVLSHITKLLLHLYRSYEVSKGDQVKSRRQKTEMVKDGLKYIRNHFQENISVDDIVSAIGYSKYYFLRTFKELTGDTVVHYLNTLKVRHAQQLIEEGKLSISEISPLCGFESPSYFTKVFKQYTGQLPSKFKSNSL